MFLLFLIFSFSAEASQWEFFKPRSEHKGRNSSSQAEGRVEHCTTGTCGESSFKSEGLRKLNLPEGLGIGIQRVIIDLYGTCAAAKPLNHILTYGYDGSQRHKRYSLKKQGEPLGKGDRYIFGVDAKTIEGGFDNVRAVNSNRPALGAYAAVAEGARRCTNHKVDVKGEKINPIEVHKMFGNGAAGKMVNGKFNSYSCGSQGYLNKQSPAQKAFRCNLEENSAPALALDCAELIGSSAVGSCKKLHPDQTIGGDGIRLGKNLLATWSLVENICLKRPNISAEAPVVSGDIFVIETHSIVITQVGNDPFGVAAAGENCNSINADDLNFAFAQSSSHREIGPIQSTAKAYNEMLQGDGYGVNAFPLNHLVTMARKMCNDKKWGKSKKAGIPSDYGHGVRQLRHNASNSNCSYPSGECPPIEGTNCSRQCGV